MEAQIGTDLTRCEELLRAGQLVAIPTETVYGLAANGLDAAAAAQIFAVKNRPAFDPLILHVPHLAAAMDLVLDFPAPLVRLAEAFWPGPLTVLLPRKEVVPDLITSGLDTVAIRVPGHPLTRELLSRLPFPLAAPSANPFGYISPTRAEHVFAQLGSAIPYILDGGPADVGLESTIVGMEGGQVTVFRLGGLTVDAIEEVLGAPVVLLQHSSSNPKSPGMLKSHYAPRKPFRVGSLSFLMQQAEAENLTFALLTFGKSFENIEFQQDLSPAKDYAEAAYHLFSMMRDLDEAPVDVILAELLPEEGLGRAINDRLRRAAADEKEG